MTNAKTTPKTPPALAQLVAAQADVAAARETLATAMSARQKAIAAALADERTNAQIGRALGTSRTTTQELINNARAEAAISSKPTPVSLVVKVGHLPD